MAEISNDTSTDTSDRAAAPARNTAGARLAAKRAAKAAQKAAARGTAAPGAEVVKSMAWVSTWFDEHQKRLLMGAGAIALGFIAWMVIGNQSDHANREAGAALHTAITTTQGIVTSGDEPAPEDTLLPTFASAQDRDKKALDQFVDVTKKFAGSKPATWAELGEANTQLALGKFADAAKSYGAALDGAGDDTFIHVRALEGLGYALEGDKKYPDAIKRFEELSRFDNGAHKILGDYHRARVLAMTGQRDEAVKILDAMLKASADKPEEKPRYASVTENARTLLTELGGKPPEKPLDLSALSGAAGGDKNALTEQVMQALRKQLAEKKKNAPSSGTSAP